MQSDDLFTLLIVLVATVPEEKVIKTFQDSLATQYLLIKADPFQNANGSLQKEARRSPKIIPGRELLISFYKINAAATSKQILSFLNEKRAVHFGALGLYMSSHFLPDDLLCLAFEDNDIGRMTALRHRSDDSLQLGIVTNTDALWDSKYGFICVNVD